MSRSLLRRGTRIQDRYEVTGTIIGEGAQSVVAKGRNRDNGEPVVIKALRDSHLNNPVHRERFRREGKVTICDPHLITPLAADDQYIVYPWADAKNLKALIVEDGFLPKPKDILAVAIRIASALTALHRKGIVHRDVKPANILYNRSTQDAYLIDLGVASYAGMPRVTRTGCPLGTPLYSAPEQIQHPDVPDPKWDLYALGCVLYFMAAGVDAFDADTIEKVIQRVLHDTPEPVSNLNPRLPKLLVTAIDRLLTRNPADRFCSVAELVAHLSSPNSSNPQTMYCLACGQPNGIHLTQACSRCGQQWLEGHRLLVKAAEHEQRCFHIPLGDKVIGRPQLGRQFKAVSREHFRLSVEEPSRIVIADAGSANGTYVNQLAATQPMQVGPKDVIDIAGLTATVLVS